MTITHSTAPHPRRHMRLPGRLRSGRAIALLTALSLMLFESSALTATASAARTTTAVSANWSGYAVSGTTYKQVTGSWVQPTATCSTTSSTTAAAFWVGLGGDSATSSALEQAGTEADCNANGTVSYSAWYELVPAASVKIPLRVAAGNSMSASVVVNGTKVTVQVKNTTTGRSYTKTLKMTNPDTSSVEWIAEAPSIASNMGTQVLPLTNFGAISFTNARATTSGGVSGSISQLGGTIQKIHLESASSSAGRFAYDETPVEATTSSLTEGGGSFSVTWKQLTGTSIAPSGPAGPGGFGGP